MDSDRGTLTRLLDVIRTFVDVKPSWGARELAREINLPPSTTHRLLQGLASEGLLRFDPATRQYQFGLEMFRLSMKIGAQLNLVSLAKPDMLDLVDSTGETCFLSAYDSARRQLIMVSAVESKQPLRFVPELFRYLPLHCGAGARAILAHQSDELVEQVIRETALQPETATSITDPDEFRRLLRETRLRGYSLSNGERVPDSCSIAAPIYAVRGEVVGAISLTVPRWRWKREREEPLAEAVIGVCRAISRKLGG